MLRIAQDIRRICGDQCAYSPEEIDFLLDYAKLLPAIADEEDVDVFINCLCKNKKDGVTVAYAHCIQSIYDISTIGYVIREADEPAVFRTLYFGVATEGVKAETYVTLPENQVVQYTYPIVYKEKVLGALTKEVCLSWNKEKNVGWMGYQPPDIQHYPYLKGLQILAECVGEAVIVLNKTGKVIFRNQGAIDIYQHYGYINDILDKPYADVSIHGELQVGPGIEHAFWQEEYICKGRYYFVKQFCYLEDEYYYILSIQDITEEKQTREHLVLKSEAVREAHHRIKNNLQTVYGLLEMQRRRTNNEEVKDSLSESMGRISSIAVSYETLLRGQKAGGRVSICAVLANVIKRLKDMELGKCENVEVYVDGDDFEVDADSVTNIALVTNELLQNSYKYAFRGCSKGTIRITVTKRQIYSIITVADDGIGFDTKILNGKKSMGLKIVENIVKGKLKGSLSVHSDGHGTVVSFDFKNK